MSKPIGDRLPAEVMAAFDGERLEEKIGPGHLLVTVDEDASPRPCMLSAGEVLATDDRTIKVALWQGTHTADNLDRGGTALFCFVVPGTVLHIRARPRALESRPGTGLRCFALAVESVERDVHEGMPVTAGITFAVEDMAPEAVVDSWTRQLDALRSAQA